MNTARIIAGIASLALAGFLYLSGHIQYIYKFGGDYLTDVRIYPAGFFTLLGLILIGFELIRDMRAGELENS
jgi:hypothetical protein